MPGHVSAVVAASRRGEPFLSTLTVSQFAVAHQAEIEPLMAVMGCDVRWLSVELPLPALPPRRTAGAGRGFGLGMGGRYEGDVVGVPELDDAFADARRVVRERLTAEAHAAGANLVIGIGHQRAPIASQAVAGVKKLAPRSTKRHPRFSRPLEFQLLGTAALDPAASDDTVRLSTLSVAEFAQLRAAGCQPAGIVGGAGHAFGGSLWSGVVARELIADTAVWETARQTAMQQLRDEAATLGADGVINLAVDVQQHTIDWTQRRSNGPIELKSSLVAVTAIATAIRRTADHA
jgi:uncharacterized protein YbjQ (UPF0145 family)